MSSVTVGNTRRKLLGLDVQLKSSSRALGSKTDAKRQSGHALNRVLRTLESHAGRIDVATLLLSALC